MREVLISIQPCWCHKIILLLKTLELRKGAPLLEQPFKCYIYMTATSRKGPLWEYDTAYAAPTGKLCNGSQKVIGEFICDYIEPVSRQNRHAVSAASCVPLPDMYAYAGPKGLSAIKAWHISSLVIYEQPKELSNFYVCDEDRQRRRPIRRPPQSWCYVDGVAG